MNLLRLLLLLPLLGLAGCAGMQMDTHVGADPNRVARGTVEMGDDVILPANAVVLVRVVDQVREDFRNPNAVRGEPTATAAISLPPNVLGEQRIEHATGSSIPFAVPFYCTDDQLAAGLILEARVSIGGHVRFFNVTSYALNTGNINDPRRIYVNQVR